MDKGSFEFEDLIGRPFVYGGRPDSSFELDCYGLVVECLSRIGVTLPQRQFSENRSVAALLMASQMNEWEPCSKEPGSVVLLKVAGVSCHVGVVIDEFRFIHTWARSGGVCIERFEDWGNKVEGFYRYCK